jgi:hypothetical protein
MRLIHITSSQLTIIRAAFYLEPQGGSVIAEQLGKTSRAEYLMHPVRLHEAV